MTFEFVPLTLRPIAATGVKLGDVVIALAFAPAVATAVATGVPPGDKGIALAFMATAAVAEASTFGGGEVGVCAIVAWLRESWV